MTPLPPTTKRRLKNIAQTSAVWEGDRRPLGNMASHLDRDLDESGECIIWVDGSEGSVRAMDVVPANMGMEAMVRTLLRAIEAPQHPTQPTRPQKIIVRDREIQFFLRGALQELEINIEYSPDLPLIDQLFEGFEQMEETRPPALPHSYASLLNHTAIRLWDTAPWELLADSDILAVTLKGCDIERVYLCIMGMMSSEYGVLLYRSLESLKQFRDTVLQDHKTPEELETAFLSQDCWFVNYEELEGDREEETEEEEVEEFDLVEIMPFFGSIHPYEGMRPFIDEEEAAIIYAVLESLLRFCDRNSEELAAEPIEVLSKSYRINFPPEIQPKKTIATTVETLPELTAELLAMDSGKDVDDFIDTAKIDIPIQEDLIPDGSIVTLGSISWDLVEQIRTNKRTYYQSLNIESKVTELPTILIQTTRPKAKTLIEKIKDCGGIKAVCFNPGEDPYSGDIYDLGMLQTGDGEIFIFAEYLQDEPQNIKALKRWHQRCQKTKGFCSLAIAMGAKGGSRGNPQPKDMLAIFEIKAINSKELGIGMLQLMPNFEF
ncbi:MAG: hypothetical protein ACFCU5_04625 [Pleurocapsa sp.]